MPQWQRIKMWRRLQHLAGMYLLDSRWQRLVFRCVCSFRLLQRHACQWQAPPHDLLPHACQAATWRNVSAVQHAMCRACGRIACDLKVSGEFCAESTALHVHINQRWAQIAGNHAGGMLALKAARKTRSNQRLVTALATALAPKRLVPPATLTRQSLR